MEKRIVVLYSGGPDSYITYRYAAQKYYGSGSIIPVYFNLRHRYCVEEIRAVRATLPGTVICDELSWLGRYEEETAHIPMRNIHLCLTAAQLFGDRPTTVYLAVQKDEMTIPDRSPAFISAVNNMLTTMGCPVEVTSPWFGVDKVDMFNSFEMFGDVDKLAKTWSCYRPAQHGVADDLVTVHCGDCPACIRRYIAFKLGLENDPTVYKVNPFSSETAKDYLIKAGDHQYSKDRCSRIMEALT